MVAAQAPNVDLASFAGFPAMFPPLGVTPNYTKPENHGKTAIIVGGFLVGLMLIFVANRVYVKYYINKKYSWDDLTCFLSVPFALIYYVTGVLAIITGRVGVHQYNLKVSTIIGHTWLLTGYLGVIFSPSAMMFAKVTFFLLYLQLFRPMRWLRIGAVVGAVLTTLFYISLTVAMLVFATPRKGETFVTHLQTGIYYKSITASVPMSAVGFAIDLYILVLPIAGVYRLQLSARRKVEVSLVFMTGSLACLSSLLCLYYRVLLNRAEDITWTLLPVIVTTMAEINVGIICACMPAFSLMLRHHLPPLESLTLKFYSRFSFSRGRSSYGQSNPPKHLRLPSKVESNEAPAFGVKSYQTAELNLRETQTSFSDQFYVDSTPNGRTFIDTASRETSNSGAHRSPPYCEKCGRTKRGCLPLQQDV